MAQPQQDQRSSRRFSLRLPVAVRYDSGELAAQTKDVSARGIYFYIDGPMQVGSRLEFVLTLPPEVTLTESIRVRCRGEVIRVDEASITGGRIGVAAAIETYDFMGVS